MLLTGSSGKEVAQLQQKLVEAGFDPGPLDGLFGSQTRRAGQGPASIFWETRPT